MGGIFNFYFTIFNVEVHGGGGTTFNNNSIKTGFLQFRPPPSSGFGFTLSSGKRGFGTDGVTGYGRGRSAGNYTGGKDEQVIRR
ncbi:hypothetical protein ES708_32887 [subsurface metagenome]